MVSNTEIVHEKIKYPFLREITEKWFHKSWALCLRAIPTNQVSRKEGRKEGREEGRKEGRREEKKMGRWREGSSRLVQASLENLKCVRGVWEYKTDGYLTA